MRLSEATYLTSRDVNNLRSMLPPDIADFVPPKPQYLGNLLSRMHNAGEHEAAYLVHRAAGTLRSEWAEYLSSFDAVEQDE
jgi:protein-tyrosine phosphatase